MSDEIIKRLKELEEDNKKLNRHIGDLGNVIAVNFTRLDKNIKASIEEATKKILDSLKK